MRRFTAGVALAIAILALGSPAWAGGRADGGGSGGPTIDPWINDSGAGGNGSQGGPGSPGSDAPEPPRARWVVMYLPACTGNDPNLVGADVDCALAGQLCRSTPEPLDRMYYRYRALQQPDGSRSPWTSAGQLCLRPADVPTPGRPAFTLEDFRRLPIPPARASIQPDTGRVLVNVPTNLYADATPVRLDTTLLGIDFDIRATPARYVWTVRDTDGRVLDEVDTTDPGAPYPDLRTTTTFTRAGAATITLSTVWTGEYRFAGSPWIPIDGTATVESEPLPVTAVAARTVLVDGLDRP